MTKVVVIGGGIVGNSLTGWLAELGWTDLVQLDKGPFPNPGGSTGHASNFIFPVDHSKEMTQLTLESMRQYRETGTLHECGGVEVARTEERLEELRRRMASAKSWGVEGCRLVTPAEIKELVPFVDESILLGGFYSPSVAVVDSLRFGTIMREKARAGGGPTLLELVTLRMEGHAVHDDAFYVPREKLEEWTRKDPIERYRRWLKENDVLTEATDDEIIVEVKRLLNEAMKRADESPQPVPAEAVTGVYAEPDELDTPHHR